MTTLAILQNRFSKTAVEILQKQYQNNTKIAISVNRMQKQSLKTIKMQTRYTYRYLSWNNINERSFSYNYPSRLTFSTAFNIHDVLLFVMTYADKIELKWIPLLCYCSLLLRFTLSSQQCRIWERRWQQGEKFCSFLLFKYDNILITFVAFKLFHSLFYY